MKENLSKLQQKSGLLANALGFFSVGLGIAEIVAPKAIGRLIGKSDYSQAIRGIGIRELINGIGILSQRNQQAWLWGRVGGDLIHAAMLGFSWPGRDCKEARRRSAFAMAAVGAATAIDSTAAVFSGRKRLFHLRKSISINRTPEEVYSFWHNFENLPRFMRNLESVQCQDHHSHWVAKAPAGTRIEWDADIVEEVPDSLIAWRTTEGSPVYHAGVVRFEPSEAGTIVRVELDYMPPAGELGQALAKVTGKAPEQQIESDLQSLKEVMERGQVSPQI